MKKKLTDLKNYRTDLNELGEIKIDTSRPKRKYGSTSRNHLKFLGYLILITIVILALILPAFRPIEEQKEDSSTETENAQNEPNEF